MLRRRRAYSRRVSCAATVSAGGEAAGREPWEAGPKAQASGSGCIARSKSSPMPLGSFRLKVEARRDDEDGPTIRPSAVTKPIRTFRPSSGMRVARSSGATSVASGVNREFHSTRARLIGADQCCLRVPDRCHDQNIGVVETTPCPSDLGRTNTLRPREDGRAKIHCPAIIASAQDGNHERHRRDGTWDGHRSATGPRLHDDAM